MDMDIVEYKKRIVQERIILLTCVQEHFNELCKYLESDLLLEEELYLWNEVALKVNEVAGKKYSYLQLKRNVQRILKNKESFRSVKNVSLQKSVSLTVEQQLSFSCSPLDSGAIDDSMSGVGDIDNDTSNSEADEIDQASKTNALEEPNKVTNRSVIETTSDIHAFDVNEITPNVPQSQPNRLIENFYRIYGALISEQIP